MVSNTNSEQRLERLAEAIGIDADSDPIFRCSSQLRGHNIPPSFEDGQRSDRGCNFVRRRVGKLVGLQGTIAVRGKTR